jgi:hypothetical protein
MVHPVLTCHPQRSRGTLRLALAPPSVEWTLLSAASEAPGHAVSIRRQNTLPDTNRPHPTRRSLASPRSAHKGRSPPRLSPRHPTIRVISCSREGHDFTRARTYPASVIPSEVEGPCVLAKRGASSFFRALCEKGWEAGAPCLAPFETWDSLLRRHPYRSRHLDQFVQFFRRGRPSLKRHATAKSKV